MSKWTPRQKRQYIESALRQIDELTTKQTAIIQTLCPSGDSFNTAGLELRLSDITDDIRDINEKIRNRMEGSNWSKYN